MRRIWCGAWLAGALLAGCAPGGMSTAGTNPRTAEEAIPRLTALHDKANAVHVNRFRKPYRDEQALALRQMAAECDRLLAETKSWDSSAALTASGPAESNAVRSDVRAFRSSLTDLRAAAGHGDLHSTNTAYSDALAAYSRLRSGLSDSHP
ncbi:MAG: hypothetical protein ACPMAQ_06420 [Phycisphaerae bacterium]